MGFLDNLLKKEARKIISGVVDSVVDNVLDGAKEAVNQSGISGNVQKKTQTAINRASEASAVCNEEESCYGKESVVRARMEQCLTREFPGYTLRKNVSASEIGTYDIAWTYTYGIYRDGQAVAMINLLAGANDYKRKIVLQSKTACRNAGIGYVHFILRLPNRSSYVAQQLRSIL
ncbi:MAG: hypothetical protein IJD96_00385 [Lachnospiraceae bacterium]|nr:hypothetical protein [Lachnospiraceae bacterium]